MGLRTWFNGQQIQKKLILSNFLVIVIALFPMVCGILGYEYYSMRDATLQEIRVQATIVSDNAVAALAFGDVTMASEALATLQASTDMQYAALVKTDGTVLATYQLEDLPPLPERLARLTYSEEEMLTWKTFTLWKPIFLKSEFVGSIVLEISLDSFYRRVKLYFAVVLLATLASLGVSLWLAIKLKDTITRPLFQLMSTVKRVTHNQDYSVRPVLEANDEIGDLSKAFHDLMSNLEDRDERLQNLAFFDGITGLPNRHFFKERIEQCVANALRYEMRCCLMFIDLDDFKIVNDTLGHHVGDDLLKEIGHRLNKVLRNNDLVCRIGGDEFAVILENVKDMGSTAMLAEKIIKAVSKPVNLQGHKVAVGASIGISACPDHASDTSTLLRTADSAMYVAKERMKNTFYQYDS